MKHTEGAKTKARKSKTKAELRSATAPTDFTAAMLMIASLPLSDADKAEAVRRLLKINEGK